jgi:N-(2-amino-2-carboxyethyl)-L-glutamate synthase
MHRVVISDISRSKEELRLLGDGILSIIGKTPMIPLRRAVDDLPIKAIAKLEGFNPGGSIKDRAAARMLAGAMARGEVGPSTTIVESSSGNMGIGLAQACAFLGLRFICVVDSKTTSQNVTLLRTYGAEIEIVREPDPVTGDLLTARLNRVAEILNTFSDAYWPNQYGNLDNAAAHFLTMEEIVNGLDEPPDYVLCPTSSCGTIRGCGEYIKRHRLHTKVIAVDAVGSVIFGLPSGRRLLPGHGAGRRPELLSMDCVDSYVHVTDLDCVIGCRRLLKREGILVGGSSGAALMALYKISDRISAYNTCVMLFPDRGERYLDTIFSDSWVRENLGDVFHLFEDELAIAATAG